MSQVEFSFASWRPFAEPADRRRAAIVAASAVLHAAILTPMALGLFTERTPLPDLVPPTIFVEMEPRPLLAGEIARAPTPASAAARERAPALSEAFAPIVRDRLREEDEDVPTAPAPRIGTALPTGAPPAPADAWQVTPESMAAAVGRSMRTGAGGCRVMDGRLSPGEQALCDERFNAAAGAAGPLGPRTLTPSQRRRESELQQDGAQVQARIERRGRGPSANPPIAVASPDCPGGNLRGTCAGAHLRPGFEMTDERLRRNRKME